MSIGSGVGRDDGAWQSLFGYAARRDARVGALRNKEQTFGIFFFTLFLSDALSGDRVMPVQLENRRAVRSVVVT